PIVPFESGTNLKVRHCTNGSCSTADTAVNAATIGNGFFGCTAIGINGNGRAVIAYYDRNSPANLAVVACNDTACTSATSSGNLDSSIAQYCDMTIGINGFPVIAYVNANATRLALCGNATCSTGTTFATIDTLIGSQVSVAIGTDGLPIVFYVTSTNVK